MATGAISGPALRAAFVPDVTKRLFSGMLNTTIPKNFLQLSWQPVLLPAISIPSISLNIPGLVSDIWEGILKAVPKKKTSHMKKRHRQLAGKALKDVHSVNSCPACGRPKRAHLLCPFCVSDIKQEWAKATKKAAENARASM